MTGPYRDDDRAGRLAAEARVQELEARVAELSRSKADEPSTRDRWLTIVFGIGAWFLLVLLYTMAWEKRYEHAALISAWIGSWACFRVIDNVHKLWERGKL